MQTTSYLIPWYLSVISTFVLGVYTLRHRQKNAAIPFIAMCFFATIWAFGYIFELGGASLAVKVLGLKIGYIGVIGVPLSWTAFALAYSGHGNWLSKRNTLLALIFPVITLIVIWTNELHYWFFTELALRNDSISGLILIQNPLGWWFWLHAAYVYIILVFGTYFLVREFWGRRDVYRSQMITSLIAVLLPWISNGIVIMGLMPIRIDITSLTFSVSILILGWGFFRYGFLDIAPVVHRTVFQSMADAVIVIDPLFRVVEINPATEEIFDLDRSNTITRPFQETFGKWLPLRNETISKHGHHSEVMMEGKNENTPRWFDVFISALHEDDKQKTKTSGYIITLRDISMLKENESALAIARDEAMQANSFKTQLLANVSHELRTPLGIILGYTDLLMRNSYGDINDKQNTILGRVRESTQYLDGLVSELLDQAQLDAGRLKLGEATFQPKIVFGQTCNQLTILAEAKNLYLDANISNEMPDELFGDSQRLKQILVNLVSNAIKFTDKGGITVSIHPLPDEQWEMQIADTGPGIPSDALKTIFEPFKQLDNASRSLRKGYGLGLSITRQLIKLMGGEISVQTKAGYGTTFTVTLPLKKNEVT